MTKGLLRSAAWILGLVAAVPLVVCAAYASDAFGSVGPWIPAWGMATLLATPPAIYFPIARDLANPRWRVLLGVVAVLLAVPVALLAANVFIGLSHAFGIKDFHLM